MKKQKRALTLLEIMIVIALITLITGVIGYNMRGTLDKGKVFKTEQAKEQLHDMLLLAMADGDSPALLQQQPAACLKKLGIAKDVNKILLDGWGQKFTITYVEADGDFLIESEAYKKFKERG